MKTCIFRPCPPVGERVARQVKHKFPVLLGLGVTKHSAPDFSSPPKS